MQNYPQKKIQVDPTQNTLLDVGACSCIAFLPVDNPPSPCARGRNRTKVRLPCLFCSKTNTDRLLCSKGAYRIRYQVKTVLPDGLHRVMDRFISSSGQTHRREANRWRHEQGRRCGACRVPWKEERRAKSSNFLLHCSQSYEAPGT